MHPIASSLPSRRDVLSAGAAGLGLLAAASVPFVRPARAAVSPTRLVMLYLDGGCDTLNVVVPQAASVHATYLARRPQIAISTANSLSLAAGPGTSAYRLHPSLPKTLAQWNAGDVAIVNKVGYPIENLSHFESQDIYASAVRAGTAGFLSLGIPASGWIARLADTAAPTPLGAIALGMGRPAHFAGGSTACLQAGGLSSFKFESDWHDFNGHPRRKKVARDVLALDTSTGAQGDARVALLQAHDLSDQIQAALASHATHLSSNGLAYPDHNIGRRLSDVAAMTHGAFGTRVYLTACGGFDTHGAQGGTTGTLAGLLTQLDDALAVFSADLIAQGEWQRTVVCVHSEFGRRNYENASQGTDHGGAHAMVLLGGAVNGGMYGPDLTVADLTGEYVPYGVDFRDVLREVLADHLGVDPTPILPDPQPSSATLGLV